MSLIVCWFWSGLKPIERKKGTRIIVLDEGRLRDDLEGMSECRSLEIYQCPRTRQDRITKITHYLNISDAEIARLHTVKPEVETKSSSVDPITWIYDQFMNGASIEADLDLVFLEKFLTYLKERKKVGALVSAGLYYRRNILWEISCRRVGLLFVCLHRESATEDPRQLEALVAEGKLQYHRPFYGHHVFAGSEHFKKALIESGYVGDSMVTVTGLPRFDIAFRKKPPPSFQERKSVLLFSFLPAFGVPEIHERYGLHVEQGFVDLFFSLHRAVCRLAIAFPSDEFVIKPKWYSGLWKDLIDRAVSIESGGEGLSPSNLRIIDSEGAQNLISAATLVISFNSTTMVESLIARKDLIVPWYAEASGKYSHNVYYKDYEDAFLVARSEHELITLAENHLMGRDLDKRDAISFISAVCGPVDGKNNERIFHALEKLQSTVKPEPNFMTFQT